MAKADEKRDQFNYKLPVELVQAFDALVERFPDTKTRPWRLTAAAVLLLLEQDDKVLNAYVGRVTGGFAQQGGMSELVRKAKAGELLGEIEESLAPDFKRMSGSTARKPRVSASAPSKPEPRAGRPAAQDDEAARSGRSR